MKYTFSDNKENRKKEYLPEARPILIFCEGECTEPEYFTGFANDINKNAMYKDKVFIDPHGLGMNTIGVVKYAKEYIKKNKIKNASVWCVFDKDSFKPVKFDNAVKMCKDNKFNCAWSNECIEYWFILHFDYYTSNNDRKCYKKYLNKKYKNIINRIYKKNDLENYNILKQYGNPKNAIKFAKRIIEKNSQNTPSKSHPATTVYLLVEELASYLSDDIKSKFL